VYGAGSPSKTLEAAASGAAVVSTPWGLECYGLPGPAVEDTEAFAARIVELLTDEDRRRELVAEQSAAVAALAPAALGPRLEQIVAQAAHAGSRATAPGRRLPRPQAISVGALAVCAVSLSVALTALPSGNLSLARPAPVIPARTAHCIPTRQPPPTARVLPTQVPALNPKRVYILVFQTNCGLLWMKLDVTTSPRLAANVTALANAHFYNGLTFYRIAPGFLIQAGTGSRAPLGHGFTIVDPPPARETYPPWTVAMANDGTVPAGTAGSDVFIVLPGSANLPRSFAVLGTLAAGMDVAEAIAAVPAQPPGDGVPTMPIVIEHAGVFSR
jgi:peptidyl-prolyl cis-trans isomerase A (cyclophilin A)